MGDKPLHPTKTRLALLRAVAAGEVHWYRSGMHGESFWKAGLGGRGLMVTSRMREFNRAGWVQVPDTDLHAVAWELTDLGRQVLQEADG